MKQIINDYSYLKGRVVEKLSSLGNYAHSLGISNQALSKKMNNESGFSQEQILKSIHILDLDEVQTYKCFFNIKQVE